MNRQSPLPERPIKVLVPPAKVSEILAGIDLSTHRGRRTRAMILMSYSGVRQGAALRTRVEDLITRKGRLWLRVRDQKVCMREEYFEMKCNRSLAQAMRAYIDCAGLLSDPTGPLFRAVNPQTDEITSRPISIREVHTMIRCRAREAGIEAEINWASIRKSGLSAYQMLYYVARDRVREQEAQ